MYSKPFKICQRFKYIKTLYRYLQPKNIAELKSWDLVHVYLIGSYSNFIIQQQTGGAITSNNVSLTCMTMINPATGWFEIIEITGYKLNKVTASYD